MSRRRNWSIHVEGCCPSGGNKRQQWPLSTRMYTNIEPQNASRHSLRLIFVGTAPEAKSILRRDMTALWQSSCEVASKVGNPALRIVQLAHQRERTYDGERRVIRAFEITLDTVGPPWHLSHLAEMYGSNPRRACSVSRTTEQEQARLEKMKELTNMLKDTDKNLTICEEILATYVKKRLKEKRAEMQRRSELENKMAEILENLKTRLLVE
ncbi:hypothetical protein HN011_007932 [Eciton burchellii]|nr:hypothetical protein HN011_007932 [Eciton burchellii]